MSVRFEQHSSKEYPPRTLYNVKHSHATLSINHDPSSAGARLVRKLVAEYDRPHFESAYDVYFLESASHFLDRIDAPEIVLNVAGNGIGSFLEHGWSQFHVDDSIYELLSAVLPSSRVKTVRTGGQTGVDEAAAKSALRLGLEVVVTYPHGYRIRDETGKDVFGADNTRRIASTLP